MTTKNTTYQHPIATWQKAKEEARQVLIERAKKGPKLGRPITYGELCSRVGAIKFDPNDAALHAMLGEISEAEDAAKRGMLSVLVVLKEGKDQGYPGGGFYRCAEGIGYTVPDKLEFFTNQLQKVYTSWKAAT